MPNVLNSFKKEEELSTILSITAAKPSKLSFYPGSLK